MSESALISCVVPVYNGERFLAEALDSIFTQSYRPLQVIVVDDGSTDGTASAAQRYCGRITYLRQDHAGPATARNRGIRAATGEFLAFLDADDLWVEDKLARQMSRFESRPELEMCTGHVRNFWVPEMAQESTRVGDAFLNDLPGFVLQTLLVRRSAFDRVGYLDEKIGLLGDDTDWFVRAKEQSLVAEMLPDVLVHRRMHQTNISRATRRAEGKEDIMNVLMAKMARRRGEGTN